MRVKSGACVRAGMQSRFPISLEFEDYSYDQMAEIFVGMVRERKLQ